MRAALTTEKKEQIRGLVLETLHVRFDGSLSKFCKVTGVPQNTVRRFMAGAGFPNNKNLLKLRTAIPEILEIQKTLDKNHNNVVLSSETSDDWGDDMALAENLVEMVRDAVVGRVDAMQDGLKSLDRRLDRLENLVTILLEERRATKGQFNNKEPIELEK